MSYPLTTWRELIYAEMAERGESWGDVVSCTLSDDELDIQFDDGFGLREGRAFTVWTAKRVYFPTVCDGAESAASVSREPDGMATDHIG